MHRLVDFSARALLTLAALVLSACATRPPADLVVTGAWIHDGRGLPPVQASLLVRHGRIEAVGGQARARRRIDARGQHLVPGLIDMHVHLAAVEGRPVDPGLYLRRGITTVRDLGGFADELPATGGLRVLPAVSTLNGAGHAPFHVVIDSPGDADGAVARLASQGAQVVKVHRALGPDILPAVIAAAHRRGLKVTGHIPLGLHPLRACELGMDGIEHVGSLIEAFVSAVPKASQDDAIRYLTSDASEPLYRCLRDRRVTVTPTLALYQSIARTRAQGAAISDEHRRFIASLQAIALRLHRSGVPLLIGSDSSALDRPAVAPGSSLIEELQLLLQAGLSPPEVLEIAGANAARSLGLAADGRLIAAGQRADFLLLASDPRTDLAGLARPLRIFVAGEQLEAPDASAGAAALRRPR